MQLEDVGLADQAKERCEEANNKLRRALMLAQRIPRLGRETHFHIESPSHYTALDAVAETIQEIEDALSILLLREE